MGKNIKGIGTVIVALLAAIFVMVQIITGDGSSIGNLFLWLTIICASLAARSPKIGLTILILVGFYLDLMKRFLVIEGQVGMLDLIQVLALAPITFAALLLGQVVKCIFKIDQFRKQEFVAFLIGVFISSAIIGISIIKDGVNLSAIAEAGAQAAYVSMIWIAFYYLDTQEKRHQFFKTAFLFFIPTLLYAYKQLLFGYSDLEYYYALSGMTIVEAPLLEGQVEYYRIFSTMNSGGAFGLTAIVLGSYILILFRSKSSVINFGAKFLGLMCFVSQIPGAGRTGWGIAIIVIMSSYFFRSKLMTLSAYGGAAILLVALFSATDEIMEVGSDLTAGKGESAWAERSLKVGTFTARTTSIKNWTTDSSYFSWFGLTDEEKEATFIHDLLGDIYVNYGLVGLILVIIVIVGVLTKSHFSIFRIKDKPERDFMAFLLAVIFGLLLGSIVSGSGIRIYPVVFYFWSSVGMVWVIVSQYNVKRRVRWGPTM